jgi:hypothetical protein
MRNFYGFLILTFIVSITLITTSAGCIKVKGTDQKGPSAAVSQATLANAVDSEGEPVNASNTFLVNAEVIYLSVRLNNAPANTQVLVKLTYVDGEASSLANTTMYNNTQSGQGTGYLAFAMKPPPGGFPQGNYSVSVSANGQEVANTPFKVENLAAQKGQPRINKFTVSANTVPQGEPVTLSWDISDATRITLQPEIGTIPNAGTRSVTPMVTTTYQIIASNDAGAAKSETTVNVTAPLAGAPDLIITDLWLEGTMIYYKVKNAGTVDTPPTYTHLYVDNLFPAMGGSSFVDVLKPGQEKVLNFSSYQWPYGADTGGVGSWNPDADQIYDPSLQNHTVKVCADAKNEAKESDDNNNCLYKIWGMLWDFDLLAVSHLPTYYNSWDQLDKTEGLNESDAHGAHIKMSDGGLEMVPESKPQGWIRGKWGVFYSDYGGITRMYPIKVPPKLKFKAIVGLSNAAQGSDGVTFKLGFLDSTDTLRFLGEKKMTVPGKFEEWVVDLGDQQGTFGYFLLQVDAGYSPTNDFAIWKQARLVQVSD